MANLQKKIFNWIYPFPHFIKKKAFSQLCIFHKNFKGLSRINLHAIIRQKMYTIMAYQLWFI